MPSFGRELTADNNPKGMQAYPRMTGIRHYQDKAHDKLAWNAACGTVSDHIFTPLTYNQEMFKLFTKVFGSKYERDVKTYGPNVEIINDFADQFKTLSNDELRNKSLEFKETYQ
jgi:hypothetical protein